ncbi:MAG: hypothetical protein GXN93_01325 [Candidatus Diapherotrites archaeon]|nr:hypothetical protein [Candidatus Diapherotrites archaeon]
MRRAWNRLKRDWPILVGLSAVGLATGAGLAVLSSLALYPYDTFVFSYLTFLGISLARSLVLKRLSGAKGAWPVVRRVGIDAIVGLVLGIYVYLTPLLTHLAVTVGSGDLYIIGQVYGWLSAVIAIYLIIVWFWAGAEAMQKPIWKAVGDGYEYFLRRKKKTLGTLAVYLSIYAPYFLLNVASTKYASAGWIAYVNIALLVAVLIPLGEAYYWTEAESRA